MSNFPTYDLRTITEFLSLNSLGYWTALDSLPKAFKSRGVVSAIEGSIEIDGKNLQLIIGFSTSFPLSVPIIYLKPHDALGQLAHLETDGYICYVRGDGQFLDFTNPEKIVAEALKRAITTLTDGIRGENRKDLINGFPEYWVRLPNAELIRSVSELSDTVKKILLAKETSNKPKSKPQRYIGDDEHQIRSLSSETKKMKFFHQKAIYVPIEPKFELLPPAYGTFWTLDFVQNIVDEHALPETRKKLRHLTSDFKKTELVIFGMPRPAGGMISFGINFFGVKNRHPLCKGAEVKSLQPIYIDRLDRDYLFPRGGSSSKFSKKHVAIIGCGSVGSHIAVELAKSGVGAITLIDNDRLSYENVLRHAVGQYAVGNLKTNALKQELEQTVPFVQVSTINDRIENLLLHKKFDWRSYDLVILATGEPTINLYVNQLIHREEIDTPLLFTWLEPYGIGGHSIMERDFSSPGCLECLYDFSDDGLINRAAFAAPDQTFLKDLSGCGSLYTPYGSFDSIRTAGQSVHLALQSLSGTCGNQLLSWKGDSTTFLREGYHLTERYNLDEVQLNQHGNKFSRQNCPICSRKRGTDG